MNQICIGFIRAICCFSLFLLFLLNPALRAEAAPTEQERQKSWQQRLQAAQGKTVNWHMWGGDPAINTFVNGYLRTELAQRFDITLRQVPVPDIAPVVNRLLVEKQSQANNRGQIDLLWINGENFTICKEAGLLYGPFAEHLPNSQYLDWSTPTLSSDFGTPVDFMESPLGSAQLVFIHDTARIQRPPSTMDELFTWIRQHPGRFTYPAPPDFTGSAFLRQVFYAVNGQGEKWHKGYSEQEATEAITATMTLLKELTPLLWRSGKTYAKSYVHMNTLFADGEVDFSFSYAQAEAAKNIARGLFPPTVRTLVFTDGTLANTHFVAIPFNTAQPDAAMVVANFLLSPEAQLAKANPQGWGDFPVLSIKKLPEKWQEAFADLKYPPAVLQASTLQAHQVPELPSALLLALEKAWHEQILFQ